MTPNRTFYHSESPDVGISEGLDSGSGLCALPCSYLDPLMLTTEAQQQAQLAGLHSLNEQLQQPLDLQNSTLASVQDSLQAAGSTASL